MDYVDREIPKEGEWLKVRYLLRSLQEDIDNKRSKLKFKIILKIQSNLFRTASSRCKSSLVDLEMLMPKTDRPILTQNRNRGEDPIAPPISTTRSTRARRGRGSRSAKITRGFRSSVPRRDADGVRRHSSFLAVWYHVPCWLRSNTHTHAIRDLRILVELHYALPYVTAYPVAPHPPTGFVPAPTQPPTYGVAGAAPYGVFPNQPQLYATQGPPPPTYDQTLTHPMMYQPMYGQGYPLQYYPPGYPLQYYPPLAATTAYYPTMQPAPVRPTIMVPNGFDGTRFDGISQPVLPPPPPGVAANAAQLAAMAGHSVALSQKKGSFLGGGTEGGYTFW